MLGEENDTSFLFKNQEQELGLGRVGGGEEEEESFTYSARFPGIYKQRGLRRLHQQSKYCTTTQKSRCQFLKYCMLFSRESFVLISLCSTDAMWD